MLRDIIEPILEIGYEVLDTIFEFEENDNHIPHIDRGKKYV